MATENTIVQSPAYKECIGLSATNPSQALAKADAWMVIDSGIAAQHCRAMALYGLKRYTEAGDALNSLRVTIPQDSIELRSFVTKQASAAWLHAGRTDAAFAVLDSQLADLNRAFGNNAVVAKQTADILLERARLNITYGKPKLAAKDLDQAISLTPLNANLLIERATAFEMIGDLGLARADTEAALSLKPDDARARDLLVRLDGKK